MLFDSLILIQPRHMLTHPDIIQNPLLFQLAAF